MLFINFRSALLVSVVQEKAVTFLWGEGESWIHVYMNEYTNNVFLHISTLKFVNVSNMNMPNNVHLVKSNTEAVACKIYCRKSHLS